MYGVSYEVVCKERSWDLQRRSQQIQLDEATWGLLEERASDGAIYRLCGQILLRLERWLPDLSTRLRQQTATPGVDIAWRLSRLLHKRGA